ncbi:MAG: hypothetical protein D6772_14410 [Bacteroidetes bacterium]|nr:MAG: hypothetical protein D6772_14410 [Bacteroidota bacterium]
MDRSTAIHTHFTRHELFRGFSASAIERIVAAGKMRRLQSGEVLIPYGVKNEHLYLIIDGELQVILEKEGTVVSIPIQAGECLGEISLIEGTPTTAKAICQSDSRVLVIPETVFWEQIALSQQGVKNLMHIMAQRLHRNNQALIKEIAAQLKYKQLERDLATAGNIQSNIVPDGSKLFPHRSEIDIYACTQQARAVGGDFYDAIALNQDHIYIAIGDATGKGMPAALFMMRTFTSLRFLVSNYPNFADVLPALNNNLARKNDDMMFASIWAGILNVRTGLLQYASGGHHPPFAALKGDSFRIMQPPSGPIVGVVEDAAFELATLQMEAGDTIFLYTDGLPEALNKEQVPFGEARIQKALNVRLHGSMRTLVDELKSTVTEFVDGAPTHDDLTMLALRYKGVQV